MFDIMGEIKTTACLVVIGDIRGMKKSTILVPNRKAFADLLNKLPDHYSIGEIVWVDSYQEYLEFLKELTEDSKPEGLNFGLEK